MEPWPEPRPEPRAVGRGPTKVSRGLNARAVGLGICYEPKKEVLDPSPMTQGRQDDSLEPWPEPRPEPDP